MPVLYYLKDPPVTLAATGDLSERAIKELCKTLKLVKCQATDGRIILIVVTPESNISYIKDISDEQLAKMKEVKETMAKGGRIQPAKTIPGRGGQSN